MDGSAGCCLTQGMTCIPGPPSDVASIDFETYSEAGFFINENGLWKATVKGKPGLKSTGTYNYARHPSTKVISLAYDLHDVAGIQLWFPGLPEPEDLLEHVRRGGLIEAHNSMFEYWIWNHTMASWPKLHLSQMRCTMSRCAATGLPQALGNVHHAIDMPVRKQDIGKDLIKRFSVPHNYKKPKHTMGQMHEYCMYDVATEDALSHRIPALEAREHAIWQMDQHINDRGVQIDVDAARALAAKVETYVSQAGSELEAITNGSVTSPREVERIGRWLEERGIKVGRTKKGRYKLDKEEVENLFIQTEEGSPVHQVLSLRQQFSLASVDKIKTMCHLVDDTGRLRGMFRYYGAHTGRWTSTGVQLQNLPGGEMKPEEVDRVLEEIKCGNWSSVEGESPLATISSLVRGLFIAAPGHELISSDFSSIEGRGAAMLSGEQWRIDEYRGDGNVYERTASDLTGIPYEDILNHKILTGEHHKMRKLGKTGELASQYQGWENAWLRFGAGKFFKDRHLLKRAILRWRDASPMIPEMWGGQVRKHPERWEWHSELYGLEGAVIKAMMAPDTWQTYRSISFRHDISQDVLLCRLPCGRFLWYRNPRLHNKWHKRSERWVWRITYKGWSQKERWHDKDIFGGRFFENIVQAVCRNIMADSMLRMEAHGYPLVIHVHDEPVAEVPRGFGCGEEVRSLMRQCKGWYRDWPIEAGEAWRGHRFRKD